MDREGELQDFVMKIDDVFTLSDRGPAVIGQIQSGVLTVGDSVEIWEGSDFMTTATVVGIDAGVRSCVHESQVGLVLRDVERDVLRPGQHVRRRTVS